jgi:hypothetical protein
MVVDHGQRRDQMAGQMDLAHRAGRDGGHGLQRILAVVALINV